jgi:GNAT superfamily N-acetyltransferase
MEILENKLKFSAIDNIDSTQLKKIGGFRFFVCTKFMDIDRSKFINESIVDDTDYLSRHFILEDDDGIKASIRLTDTSRGPLDISKYIELDFFMKNFKCGEISRLYVHPNFQNHTLSKELFLSLTDYCNKHSFDFVFICFRTGALERYYKNLGFNITRNEVPYLNTNSPFYHLPHKVGIIQVDKSLRKR